MPCSIAAQYNQAWKIDNIPCLIAFLNLSVSLEDQLASLALKTASFGLYLGNKIAHNINHLSRYTEGITSNIDSLELGNQLSVGPCLPLESSSDISKDSSCLGNDRSGIRPEDHVVGFVAPQSPGL